MLKILDSSKNSFINCIYLPPYIHDYQTILRNPQQANLILNMTRKEYERHIQFINSVFPGKIQLLLQNPKKIMNTEEISYYNKLGINNFCSSSSQQSEIIRNTVSNSNIVGSISMKISKDHLEKHPEYNDLFDSFVLHFPYSRSINEIKQLPTSFKYLLLINSYCNIHCKGDHHWFSEFKKEDNIPCPGIMINSKDWLNSALIRPMDLKLFDPYIQVYKLQDRGWPTSDIIRDFILYTSNYSIYPNITIDEKLYNYTLDTTFLKT